MLNILSLARENSQVRCQLNLGQTRDGDELIVDRSVKPRDGHVVIAVIDGEMTVKRLSTGPSGVVLKAENPDYPDLPVAELSDFRIWGVATTCLHHL